MNGLSHFLYDHLISLGMSDISAKYLNMTALLILLLLVLVIVDLVIRKFILNLFVQFSNQTKTNFDNYLVDNKVPRNVAHIIPLIIALNYVPLVFIDFQNTGRFLEKGLQVFSILLTIWVIRCFVLTVRYYLN